MTVDIALGGLVVVAALVLGALAGVPLTAGVLRLAARSSDSGGQQPAPDTGAPDPGALQPTPDAEASPAGAPAGVLRGGTWIGVLERLAVVASLLAGYPSGIAFVLAIKGLGRYPEIRDHPDLSERFVIGTFASLLWAAAVGVAGRVLLGAVVGR